MHPRLSQSHGKLLTALSLAILATGMTPSWGDDTGILGRLFRLGGGSTDSSPSTGPAHRTNPDLSLMAARPARRAAPSRPTGPLPWLQHR